MSLYFYSLCVLLFLFVSYTQTLGTASFKRVIKYGILLSQAATIQMSVYAVTVYISWKHTFHLRDLQKQQPNEGKKDKIIRKTTATTKQELIQRNQIKFTHFQRKEERISSRFDIFFSSLHASVNAATLIKKNKLNANIRKREKISKKWRKKTLVERSLQKNRERKKKLYPSKHTDTEYQKQRKNSNYTSTWSAVFENPWHHSNTDTTHPNDNIHWRKKYIIQFKLLCMVELLFPFRTQHIFLFVLISISNRVETVFFQIENEMLISEIGMSDLSNGN